MDRRRGQVDDLVGSGRRYARRKLVQARRWLGQTSHLERVSVLVFAPLLIAVVTLLSNLIGAVSFLLFPPLASGTYTLFADPEGAYSSPVKFVGGMTLGALSGWAALLVSARFLYGLPVGPMEVHPAGAAFGILLTGVLTWLLDLEEPTAFSTALLVLITGTSQLAYIVGVMLSSSFVALVFVAWRSMFYEERATYLYGTTDADDRVLVPMRTEAAERTAAFGARLAAAHDASKVVLFGMITDEDVAAAESDIASGTVDPVGEYIHEEATPAERRAADVIARRLEQHAASLQATVGVPTDVVVSHVGSSVAGTILQTADATDCDLVVAPYEERDGELVDYVRDLFQARFDVVAFKSNREEPRWKRVMVTVRSAGDVANAMVEYAQRLAGQTGTVSVCSVIASERDRRPTERMLANLVEVVDIHAETRVSQTTFRSFVERNGAQYDLLLMGASTDRSKPSRIIKRPAFEQVSDVETDVAIVHRG
ncbi:MAG: HPP family protein [Halobacteriota archaeon]